MISLNQGPGGIEDPSKRAGDPLPSMTSLEFLREQVDELAIQCARAADQLEEHGWYTLADTLRTQSARAENAVAILEREAKE